MRCSRASRLPPRHRLGPLRRLRQTTDHLEAAPRLMQSATGTSARSVVLAPGSCRPHRRIGRIGPAKSTVRPPCAISRQTTPSAVSTVAGIASTIRSKVGSLERSCRSQCAFGDCRIEWRFAQRQQPSGIVEDRSPDAAFRGDPETAAFLLACFRAATKPGRSRVHWARRSTRYFTSPALYVRSPDYAEIRRVPRLRTPSSNRL